MGEPGHDRLLVERVVSRRRADVAAPEEDFMLRQLRRSGVATGRPVHRPDRGSNRGLRRPRQGKTRKKKKKKKKRIRDDGGLVVALLGKAMQAAAA